MVACLGCRELPDAKVRIVFRREMRLSRAASCREPAIRLPIPMQLTGKTIVRRNTQQSKAFVITVIYIDLLRIYIQILVAKVGNPADSISPIISRVGNGGNSGETRERLELILVEGNNNSVLSGNTNKTAVHLREIFDN